MSLADNFCIEINAHPPQPTRAAEKSESPEMFFLIAILLVMVAPLVVPVAVSIIHTLNGWTQRGAGSRPVFAPALAGAAA